MVVGAGRGRRCHRSGLGFGLVLPCPRHPLAARARVPGRGFDAPAIVTWSVRRPLAGAACWSLPLVRLRRCRVKEFSLGITLGNAFVVLDHRDRCPAGSGYTLTRHHIGHLGPGDWWLPAPDLPPHTVTGVHRRAGRVVLIDQFGIAYTYADDAVVSTAVPDPRVLSGG